MRTVICCRAEQTGNHGVRRDSVAKQGSWMAGKWKIDIVNDKFARFGFSDQIRCQLCGVFGRMAETGFKITFWAPTRIFQWVVRFECEVLRKCDGWQSVKSPSPRTADRAAGQNKAECGIESHVDSADDSIEMFEPCSGAWQQMGQSDIDAIARRPVDRPRGMIKTAIGLFRRDGAVA